MERTYSLRFGSPLCEACDRDSIRSLATFSCSRRLSLRLFASSKSCYKRKQFNCDLLKYIILLTVNAVCPP